MAGHAAARRLPPRATPKARAIDRRSGLVVVLAAALLAACSSGPRQGSSPGVGLLGSLEVRDHRALYDQALVVIEQCGTRPLGQQALLLLAASELDPRNPEARPSLALTATEIVLGGVEPGNWSSSLAESLHLLSRRLGAERGGPQAAEQRELRSRAAAGSEDPAGDGPACEAAPWPRAAPGAEPPSLRQRPYPEVVAELRRQIAELEAELERLRRITTQP